MISLAKNIIKSTLQYMVQQFGYCVVSQSYLEATFRSTRAVSTCARILADLDRANEVERSQIAAFCRFAAMHQQSSWAECLQDLWVIFELREIRAGFFVEAGASDGIRNSNTYLLEREYGWRGVLVEPIPEVYQRLALNRPGAVCLEACVGPRESEFVLMVPEDTQLASAEQFHDRDLHAGSRIRNRRRVVASAIEVNSAIALGRPPNDIVHFISLDTEGGEPEILEAIDFERWRILCVCVEHNYRDPDRQRLKSLMFTRGFSLAPFVSAMGQDYWFVNRQLVLEVCGAGNTSSKDRLLDESGVIV